VHLASAAAFAQTAMAVRSDPAGDGPEAKRNERPDAVGDFSSCCAARIAVCATRAVRGRGVAVCPRLNRRAHNVQAITHRVSMNCLHHKQTLFHRSTYRDSISRNGQRGCVR
jgi:hypothetical protein